MRLQIDSRRLHAELLVATLCLLGGLSSDAQSVGSREFMQLRPLGGISTEATTAHMKWCEMSGAGAHADGEIVDRDGPALTLSISKAEFITSNRKPYIEMTVVLKNHGIGSTLLPWSDSPVRSTPLSLEKDSQQVGYQLATMEFFLGAPFTHQGDLKLLSHVALWSQPNSPAQSIQIAAGQWIELHVRAEIQCVGGDATRCLNRLRGSKLQVSGWWYQRLLTELYKGDCVYSSGAYTERELESHVVDVTGTPYQSSEDLVFDVASASRQGGASHP